MKLFTKYNRVNISASILVFLAGCIAFYFVLRYVMIKQIDDSLRTEQTEIKQFIKEHNSIPEIVEAYDQKISYLLVSKPIDNEKFVSQKLRVKDNKHYEYERIRLLKFGVHVSGRNYQVSVSKSQIETEDLLVLILLIAIGMTGLILLTTYFINTVVIRRLWKPFYATIDSVQQFRVLGQQTMELPPDRIEEFDLLNQSINMMTRRIHDDYNILKVFTSNAAHEMQTPLAVIINSIDVLIQQEQFLQLADEPILTIQKSADKLVRLNRALLLLTRLENKQFETKENIRLDTLIEFKYNEIRELLIATDLKSRISVVPLTAKFHEHLAEIIFDNLFNNALLYNMQQGSINIELTNQQFSISNTSNIPPLDSNKVFQRFYRHPETKSEGNGLGLSIVKQVCDLAGYPINYAYSNNMHVFSITLQ